MVPAPSVASRGQDPSERYRLYIDESGDHAWKRLEEPAHRYLCLLGCFFKGSDYAEFHRALEDFKQAHIPHSPDEPVILHRSHILNRKGPFWRLRDPEVRGRFDDGLVELCQQARFLMVAVCIDKAEVLARYPESPAHPYHLALGFLLQRYCGYLNHIQKIGDVLAESRGGREDRLLADSYERVYLRGAWMRKAEFFQRALSSRQLKIKRKSDNIAGLQLADILAHPVKQRMLAQKQRIAGELGPFSSRLLEAVESKFNRHLYDGRIEGYGTVFYPK